MLADLESGEISLHTSEAELRIRYGSSFALDRRMAFEELARIDGCLVLIDDTGIDEQDERSAAKVVAVWPVNGDLDTDALLSLASVHSKRYAENRRKESTRSTRFQQSLKRRVTSYHMPIGDFQGKPAAFFAKAGRYIGELSFLES